MKKKIAIITITLLLVINLSAFVTMAYNRLSYKKCPMATEGDNAGLYLCQELSLNQDQVEKVKSIRRDFSAQASAIIEPLQKKRAELVTLLAREKPDLNQIDATASAIDSLQSELHRQVIKYLLEEKAVFSPEQQKKFFSMIHERLNCTAIHHGNQGLNMMDNCVDECDTTEKCPINETE